MTHASRWLPVSLLARQVNYTAADPFAPEQSSMKMLRAAQPPPGQYIYDRFEGTMLTFTPRPFDEDQ
jgi:hypothetical protein